jgi:hypothetical protein
MDISGVGSWEMGDGSEKCSLGVSLGEHLFKTGRRWEMGDGRWKMDAISTFECYSFLKTIDYFPKT